MVEINGIKDLESLKKGSSTFILLFYTPDSKKSIQAKETLLQLE